MIVTTDTMPVLTLQIETLDEKIDRIRRETGASILALYPQHKQSNMTARAVELMCNGQTDSSEFLEILSAWETIKRLRDDGNRRINE